MVLELEETRNVILKQEWAALKNEEMEEWGDEEEIERQLELIERENLSLMESLIEQKEKREQEELKIIKIRADI